MLQALRQIRIKSISVNQNHVLFQGDGLLSYPQYRICGQHRLISRVYGNGSSALAMISCIERWKRKHLCQWSLFISTMQYLQTTLHSQHHPYNTACHRLYITTFHYIFEASQKLLLYRYVRRQHGHYIHVRPLSARYSQIQRFCCWTQRCFWISRATARSR